MTQAEITQNIRKLVLEVSSGLLDSETLYVAANQAQNEIAERILTTTLLGTATLTFTAGSAAKPSDFISFSLLQDTAGLRYNPVNLADYRDVNNTEKRVTEKETTILVYPTTTASLQMDYFRYPATFSDANAAAQCELPKGMHEVAVLGGVYRVLSILQEKDAADAALINYENKFAIKAGAVSRNEEKKVNRTPMFSDLHLNLKGGIRSTDTDRW